MCHNAGIIMDFVSKVKRQREFIIKKQELPEVRQKKIKNTSDKI